MKKIFLFFIIAILTMGAGYEGTLPDLESEMSYKIKSKKVKYPPLKTSDKEPKRLQKVPKEDKEYVDIIIKNTEIIASHCQNRLICLWGFFSQPLVYLKRSL